MSFSSVAKNVPYRIIAQESWPVNRIFSSRPHSQELISHNEWKKKFTPFFAVRDFRLKLTIYWIDENGTFCKGARHSLQ